MEKSKKDENKRRKKSRKRVEMIGGMKKKKKKKQRNNNNRNKVFYLQRLWAYCPSCRNMEKRQEEGPTQRSLNKFEVLKSRIMNVGEGSGRKIRKDRNTILREERLRKEKLVNI